MKRWFLILLVLLSAFSCVGQKDDPIPEPRLSADLTALNATAGETATFTVYSGAEDVTAYATIRNVTDDTVLDGNVFAPMEEGEWTFVAEYEGLSSEELVITAFVVAEEGKDFFRRSLVLDFTGTWCVNCPKMDTAIEEAMAARPGRLVPVSVHCMAVDPMYLKPLSDNLVKQFGVKAYPSAVVDLDPGSLISQTSSELLLSHVDRLLESRGPAAGLRIESVLDGDKLSVTVESKAVREGEYTLSVILLEDGIVAKQTGADDGDNHVHNHVLRAWADADPVTLQEDGTASMTLDATAISGKYRIVAVVSRNGLVDNVMACAAGASADWQYEEDND
ncbi:MAG: Omp28-related outer membrane protein [Bacteroidales bacterium]|nr:Omp28-related outer membrane protein [Bacteroidales bacterium]